MTTDCSSLCERDETRRRCPVNGNEYARVPLKTVLHHIKRPWQWQAQASQYYFCDDPECEVVYFGEDDSVIKQDALRTRIGVKEDSVDAPVCYCFDISLRDSIEHPEARSFVIEKTRLHHCECETRNPSGRCCLKDFPHS